MPQCPFDLRSLVAAIEAASLANDFVTLAAISGLLNCLTEKCRAQLDRTVGGSVMPPENEGRLLDVQQAARATGWSPDHPHSGLCPQWFYRNSISFRSLRRPSPGKIRFLESLLIEELRERGRLP
jgi:hypothetical protein